MNKIFMIGHVGQDPKRTATGTGVTYSLAIKERTRVDGEWTDKTTWVDVVHWGQNADFAEKWLKKGTKAMIEGRLNINERVDGDGVKKRFTNVVAEHAEILSRPTDGQSNDRQTTVKQNEAAAPVNDDDLPF